MRLRLLSDLELLIIFESVVASFFVEPGEFLIPKRFVDRERWRIINP